MDLPAPKQSSAQESSPIKELENRADIYMARKYYAEAVELYKKLLDQEPNNAIFHNKMGIAYHQMQDFGAAKGAYRKAVQLNPNYAQAVNNLAAVEYGQKNYRAAILTYLEALKLNPNDPIVYSNLGTAYFAYDEFEYAMTSYRYALMLDPALFERSSRSGTIVHQRENKNPAAFYFYLAKVFAEMGRTDDTLLYLQKAWEEGFPDILKALQDKAFAFLAEEPRFVEFISLVEASEKEALSP